MEDERIVELFWSKDERAIEIFVKQYKKLCLSVAFSILGDHGRAEECVSDVCFRLWNAIPPECPRSLKAYSVRITRNVALHYLEKENACKRSAVLVELSECVSEEAPDMEEGKITKIIDEFLEKQKPLAAKLFVRRYYYNETVREIAERLGISENKASKILSKMRKELKRYLTEKGVSLE
jgi:RNA polymerase sigma-70 factor (ECF subfamily)